METPEARAVLDTRSGLRRAASWLGGTSRRDIVRQFPDGRQSGGYLRVPFVTSGASDWIFAVLQRKILWVFLCFTKSALRSSQASFPSHRRHKRMWEL